MTTKSPTDLAQDAQAFAANLLQALEDRPDSGSALVCLAADVVEAVNALAALITEQAAAPKVEPQAPRPFKVGDRVRFARFVSDPWNGDGPALGWEARVTDNDGTDYIPIRVEGRPWGTNSDDVWWWFDPEALDLLPSEES